MKQNPRSAALGEIVAWCDRTLRTQEFADYPGALNGLQVQNRGRVRKIAAAVDGSLATAQKAASLGADLLVVHHGLFWGPSHPWVGRKYELFRHLLDSDLAVYSSHLPLDAHPKLGNNAILGRALGLGSGKQFFEVHGSEVGLRFAGKWPRQMLAEKLTAVLGEEPVSILGGPPLCREVAVITGGAGSELARVASAGIDTFITGEGAHWTGALAEELGVNLYYGGHYATETFGVKALAAALSKRFRIPWCFVDHPTGL